MARTTAYTASIVAQLLALKGIEETGVIPPEKLGMNDNIFRRVVGELRKKKVHVKEETKTAE